MPADTAVTIFGLDNPRLSQTLKGVLLKRKSELLINLTNAEDWPDFKERVGVIKGVQEAIDVCDEIEKNERN